MNNNIEMRVSIMPDEDGLTGRECPNNDCEKYFKIKGGTGVKDNPYMFCPYCGYKGKPSEYFTKEQIGYAKSVAFNHFSNMIGNELKKLERHSVKGGFISFSIKVKTSSPQIKYYVEKELQEYIICDKCGCEYSIYGVFSFCPDCRNHNVFLVLEKNIDLIRKQINLEDDLYKKFGETERSTIENMMKDIKVKIIENACENSVTVFETFLKKIYELHKNKAIDQSMVLHGNSFQSIDRARDIFSKQYDIDILNGLPSNEMDNLYLLFNKRHILTHNLGIIDNKYLTNTGFKQDILDHKVEISKDEILSALASLSKISENVKCCLF